jgi:hypothetical protein
VSIVMLIARPTSWLSARATSRPGKDNL